jgi:hypothetical protein
VNQSRPALPLRLLRGFGMFWWDFLVGDTPELFVAALVIIGVVTLLSIVGHFNTAAMVVLPLLAISALTISLRRAQRAARRK